MEKKENNDLYTEKELLLRTSEGSQTAFKHIADRYWHKVYGHALAYIKSLPLAEELTQDVFISIWNNRKKLTEIERFDNWLFIITRNKILKALRKKLADTVAIEQVDPAELTWQPNVQLEHREVYALVLKGIEEMPPVRRQVFTLGKIDGKSYIEISQELGISRNTVKEHMVKALNFLRRYLVEHGVPLFSVFMITTFF